MSSSKEINKIIDLCLSKTKENSKNYINILKEEINRYELQKQNLEKPSDFQKQKLKEYYLKIEKLDNKINECLKKIEEEIHIIDK